MADQADMKGAAAGVAALSICESLLIALSDLKIMGSKETAGVLQDAAAAHRHAGAAGSEADLHIAVTVILERIIAGGNSVHHP